jgi:hypothetical protein
MHPDPESHLIRYGTVPVHRLRNTEFSRSFFEVSWQHETTVYIEEEGISHPTSFANTSNMQNPCETTYSINGMVLSKNLQKIKNYVT